MEAPPLQRKLVAILAADVAGYSRLMEADDERALATLSAHRQIIDQLILKHRGRIAGTAGDSVLAEFASVLDCAQAAIEIQTSLKETNDAAPQDSCMEFRIGLNVGDVMVKDVDIFGDGVNIAARLQALAEPGGICVSRGVRDHIRHKLAVTFEDLGEQRVKNIARAIRAFGLRPNGGTESPEGSTASAPEPPQADEVEIEFWDSIKLSANPLEYRVYLEQYPERAFASLAPAPGCGASKTGTHSAMHHMATCRSRRVVSPKLLFALAYSLLPTRKIDASPGITRHKARNGFDYRLPDGALVRDIDITQLRLLGRHLWIKCRLDGQSILFPPNLASPSRHTHSPPPLHRDQVTLPAGRRVPRWLRYRVDCRWNADHRPRPMPMRLAIGGCRTFLVSVVLRATVATRRPTGRLDYLIGFFVVILLVLSLLAS